MENNVRGADHVLKEPLLVDDDEVVVQGDRPRRLSIGGKWVTDFDSDGISLQVEK